MSVFKLECPSCGLLLTTPNPVPAGTLVRCPRCETCFGVPALEVKTAAPVAVAVAPPVTVAQAVGVPSPPPVAAAAVPAAAPVAPVAAPVAARARVAVPRAAAAMPKGDDSVFPKLDIPAAKRVGAAKSLRREKESKDTGRPAKKGKKKNANAALVWSLVAAGAVIVIGGMVAIAKFAGSSPDARTRSATPATRETQRNAGAPEKAAANNSAERKTAAAGPAADKKDRATPDKKKVSVKNDKAAGTAKKKDAMADNDSDEPKAIPGLSPAAGTAK